MIFALASVRATRARGTGAVPALRRITVLGLVVAASGPFIRGLPEWLDDPTPTTTWFGIKLVIATAALGLLAATSLVCAAHVTGRFPRGPWPWATILVFVWTWTLGWVDDTVFGLVVPALALVAPVLLTPLFAPRPRAGESPEHGPVGAAAICLALACAGAIAAPGALPPTEASPELVEHTLRWAMVTGTGLLVRDLVIWTLPARAAPHERWTGALWLVWLATSWTVLGELVHATGVPAPLTMFAGPPWQAMSDGALKLEELPRAAGAGALLALAALALVTGRAAVTHDIVENTLRRGAPPAPPRSPPRAAPRRAARAGPTRGRWRRLARAGRQASRARCWGLSLVRRRRRVSARRTPTRRPWRARWSRP